MNKLTIFTTAFWHMAKIPALYWKVSIAILLLTSYILTPQVTVAQELEKEIKKQKIEAVYLLPESAYRDPTGTKKIIVTAYSSTPDQTDSTPFIAADGTFVYDGMVAANFLPFGTRVRFPDVDEDKIYVVHDRMARRFSRRADIWMGSREEALQFGAQYITIEIW